MIAGPRARRPHEVIIYVRGGGRPLRHLDRSCRISNALWNLMEVWWSQDRYRRGTMMDVVRALDGITEPICHPSSEYILAHNASSHASLLESILLEALTNLQFEGEYMIQVGFNETSLREGILVEEVYLLLDGELQSSEDHICAILGPVFAPYPGIVYTRLQTYYVPIDPPPQGSVGRLLELGGKVRAVQNTGNTSGSGGPGSAFTLQSEDTSHDNRGTSSGQNADKRGRQKGGGRESGDEGDSSSDDDDKGKGRDLGARDKGKKPNHGPRVITIALDSTLSIKGIDGFQEVNAAAVIDITVRRWFLKFQVG